MSADTRADRFEVESAPGRIVTGVATTPHDGSHGAVVLAQGLARGIRHGAPLARFLGRHGYAAFRFDYADQVSGTVLDTARFSTAADDVAAVMRLAEARSGRPPLVIGSSVGGRIALRTATSVLCDHLVMVMPTVAMDRTLHRVTGEDLVTQWRDGTLDDPNALLRILSYDLRVGFIQDLVDHDLASSAGTVRDLDGARGEISIVAGDSDEWVDIADIVEVVDAARPSIDTYLVETMSHTSFSPPASRAVAEVCLRILDETTGVPPRTASHLTFSAQLDAVRQRPEGS